MISCWIKPFPALRYSYYIKRQNKNKIFGIRRYCESINSIQHIKQLHKKTTMTLFKKFTAFTQKCSVEFLWIGHIRFFAFFTRSHVVSIDACCKGRLVGINLISTTCVDIIDILLFSVRGSASLTSYLKVMVACSSYSLNRGKTFLYSFGVQKRTCFP